MSGGGSVAPADAAMSSAVAALTAEVAALRVAQREGGGGALGRVGGALATREGAAALTTVLLGAYLAGYRFEHVAWVSKATFNKGMTGVTTKLGRVWKRLGEVRDELLQKIGVVAAKVDERADELERKITDESERTRSDVAAVSGKVDDLSRDVRSIKDDTALLRSFVDERMVQIGADGGAGRKATPKLLGGSARKSLPAKMTPIGGAEHGDVRISDAGIRMLTPGEDGKFPRSPALEEARHSLGALSGGNLGLFLGSPTASPLRDSQGLAAMD